MKTARRIIAFVLIVALLFPYSVHAVSYSDCQKKKTAFMNNLYTYHYWVKSHKSKCYHSNGSAYRKNKTFAEAKKNKKAYLTCAVPIWWSMVDLGLKKKGDTPMRGIGNGFWETSKIKKYTNPVKPYKAVGKTIKQAVNNHALLYGDIIRFKKEDGEDVEHMVVYASAYNNSCLVFDGGRHQNYKNGLLADYSSGYFKNWKIAEIRRWAP